MPLATRPLFLLPVGTLSNIPILKGLFGAPVNTTALIRSARPQELDPVVRMMLASHSYALQETQVQDFVRTALANRDSAGELLVAEVAGRIVSAVMPVISPGRTMLVFIPNILAAEVQVQATKQLVVETCSRAGAGGVHLAQVLLDPDHSTGVAVMSSAGFVRIADLLYLQANTARSAQGGILPAGYRVNLYSPQTHQLFARTILSSYQQSLDCPAISGLRHIDDVIAGHRATGEFDPSLWFAVCMDDDPAGVLILSRGHHGQMLELVYLGLVPAHRGRGLGDWLMRKALESAAALGCDSLSLAVDAANKPALNLYWRHGLRTVGRKVAMIRDLRRIVENSGVESGRT